RLSAIAQHYRQHMNFGGIAIILAVVAFGLPAYSLLQLVGIAGVGLLALSLFVRQPEPEDVGEATAAPDEALVKIEEQLHDLHWELSENQANYRDLLDAQADIILRQDRHQRLTFANASFYRLFGLTPQ